MSKDAATLVRSWLCSPSTKKVKFPHSYPVILPRSERYRYYSILYNQGRIEITMYTSTFLTVLLFFSDVVSELSRCKSLKVSQNQK